MGRRDDTEFTFIGGRAGAVFLCVPPIAGSVAMDVTVLLCLPV